MEKVYLRPSSLIWYKYCSAKLQSWKQKDWEVFLKKKKKKKIGTPIQAVHAMLLKLKISIGLVYIFHWRNFKFSCYDTNELNTLLLETLK